MRPPDAPPAPRSHMVLRVRIDGRPWLSDVGFGSAVPPRPLAMDSEAAQATAHERYRIVRRGSRWSVRIAIEDERSEEHTSELQSLMRISYAVFCLKKKKIK